MKRRSKRGMKGKKQFRSRRPTNMRSKKAGGIEFASAKQTLQLLSDDVNTIWRLNDINLSQFDRLTNIARSYQYFRFTKIEMKFKPFADTYLPGAPGSGQGSVPYLYYYINKSDSLDLASFNALRDAGSKPIRFDDKTITVTWRPAVIAGVAANQPIVGPPTGTSFAQYRLSPWLSTDLTPLDAQQAWSPSTVPHKGLMYGVEQDQVGTAPQFYNTELTVYCQFKKLMVYIAPEKNIAKSKLVVADDE